MGDPAQTITVSIVDANDNRIAPKPVIFKPKPVKTAEAIIKQLLAAGYGRGLLLDMSGCNVMDNEDVEAGLYKYRVTGAGSGGGAGDVGLAGSAEHSLSVSVRDKIKAGLQQFCTALLQLCVSDSDEFIIFPSGLPDVIPQPLRSSIYIRRLYWHVLAATEKAGKKSGIIITGNPGVGKSAMAPLLVHRAAWERRRVVYAYKHDLLGDLLFLLDFTDPASVLVDVGKDDGELRYKWTAPDNSLLILDGKAPDGHHSGHVHTIVLSSPTVKNWNEYRKGSNTSRDASVEVLYLDVWHPVEVEKARAKLYPTISRAQAAERYISFGGCVRLVLVDLKTSWVEVSKQFGAKHVEQLGNLQLVGFRSDIPHNLVHIRAGRTLEIEYIQLASHKVAHLVLKLLTQQGRDKIRTLLTGASGQTTLAGWLGMVFEQHGHMVVPHGVTVHKRKLPPPTGRGAKGLGVATAPAAAATTSNQAGKKRPRFDTSCVDELQDRAHATHHYAGASLSGADEPQAASSGGVQASTPQFAALAETAEQAMHQLELGPTANPPGQSETLPVLCKLWDTPDLDLRAHNNFYLQPVSTNNAAWDAAISTTCSNGSRRILILQYTLSLDHGVRAGPIAELLTRLQVAAEDTVHMVFMVPDVPDRLYADYRYQPWLGVQGKRLQRVPMEVGQLEQWVYRLSVIPDRQLYSPPSSSGSGAAGAIMEQELEEDQGA